LAEALLIDSGDHAERSEVALGLALRKRSEVRDLRRREERRGGVGAGGNTGSAADTGGSVHGSVGILLRDVPGFPQVFLDGRGHPANLPSSWLGHSIGKWEGDTLVIDPIGFNGRSWLSYSGHPYTDRLHATKRLSRPHLGHLKIDVTVDDPSTYFRSWTLHKNVRTDPERRDSEVHLR